MEIPAKKGNNEIRVIFPPSGHVNQHQERMYSDRSDLKDAPRNEEESRSANKTAQVYEYFKFAD
jgi:hypothetical protein